MRQCYQFLFEKATILLNGPKWLRGDYKGGKSNDETLANGRHFGILCNVIDQSVCVLSRYIM